MLSIDPIPSTGQNCVGHKVSGNNVSNVLLAKMQCPKETQGTRRENAVQSVDIISPSGKGIFVRSSD